MIFPNLFRAAVAAVIAGYAKVRGYKVLASEDVQEARQQICDVCEFRKGEQCGICSCFIDAKVMLNTEQCPRRKWFRRWVKSGTV